MKLVAALLLASGCAVACAQDGRPPVSPYANIREANGPVNVPGWPAPAVLDLDRYTDGRCQSVRYGDIVHFTLRIENVQDAVAVLTNLRMGLGKHPHYSFASMPGLDRTTFGGGGVGRRDGSDYRLYHFRFEVPDVPSGIYHVAGTDVRASYGRGQDSGVGVPIDKYTRGKLNRYCLAVFGGSGGQHRPLVTDFRPDPVEHPATPPERPVFP